MTARASAPRRFQGAVLERLRAGKILGLKAGIAPHRFIGIWMVVVGDRLFVRPWSLKPRSWYRTFLQDPAGVIVAGQRRVRVRAVRTRSERIRRAVDRAYHDKYARPWERKYVRDLSGGKSRAATIELVPWRPAGS